MRQLFLALILTVTAFAAQAAHSAEFDPGLSGFVAKVKGLDIGYREFALFVMPGEAVPLVVPGTSGFRVETHFGTLRAKVARRWTWRAPDKPGHYTIDIVRNDGARMRLETFVMIPATKVRNGMLGRYRIGRYPAPPNSSRMNYTPPAGFVEVTPALMDIHVSPHFTLGQFLCKEKSGWPKYLVLRRRLLLKLETVLTYLDARGIPPEAVHIMSGYRTPWYNAQLGNVRYSQHTLGDAADLYIAPIRGEPMLGDVNHDGRDDFKDAKLLAASFSKLFYEPENDFLRGGIGAYPATAAHLPFVHVDARGFRARW